MYGLPEASRVVLRSHQRGADQGGDAQYDASLFYWLGPTTDDYYFIGLTTDDGMELTGKTKLSALQLTRKMNDVKARFPITEQDPLT
jgi:hypothetical protein